MSAGSSPTSRGARVFAFSPSPQKRESHYAVLSPTSPKGSPRSSTAQSEISVNPVLRSAFISDFDQHCKRIVSESEQFLTFSQFEELLVDLHFISPLSTRADASKVLLVKLWKFVRDPDSGLASKEITKRVLMEIVGIERLGLNVDVQSEFRSFAVARLRYLHLQEHAITQDPGILRSFAPNSRPRVLRSPQSLRDPQDKENSPRPSVISSPSPLRIPQTKAPFATVKVNLTPHKFDVINVFEGDDVELLARKFAEKHCLGRESYLKLCGLLETKLATLRPSF